jgi:hypothetical protein
MKKYIYMIFGLLPSISFAQSLRRIDDINSLSNRLISIGNLVIYLLVSVGVIFIVYNVVFYFIKADAKDRSESGLNILWGIVGLAIIVSLWGLVNFLIQTFYTEPNITPDRFPNANFIEGNKSGFPVLNQP